MDQIILHAVYYDPTHPMVAELKHWKKDEAKTLMYVVKYLKLIRMYDMEDDS